MGSCFLCHPCEESQVTPALPLGCPGGSSWPSNAGHLVPLIAPEAGPGDPISAQNLGPRNQAAMDTDIKGGRVRGLGRSPGDTGSERSWNGYPGQLPYLSECPSLHRSSRLRNM